MSGDETEEELTKYEVSVPLYKIAMSGKVATKTGEASDGTLPASVETIEDFDEIRYQTSDMHLNSAFFFADEARRIEEFFEGENEEDEEQEIRFDARVPLGNRHDIYVVNSVISTASFLEALINEFYDDHESIAEKEEETIREEMKKEDNVSYYPFYRHIADFGEIENRSFEFKSALSKYQYMLTFANKEIFDTGAEPYQSVAIMNGFRNNLVHAEAEWIHPEDEDFSIGESLEGKFDRNPLASEMPLPRQYFSFDCAKWCIESTFQFIEGFYERIGVKLPDHIRARNQNIWDVDSIIEVEEANEQEN